MRHDSSKGIVARAVTQGPRQHFFGYYEKTPWSGSGRYLLALETATENRPLTPEDTATVGLIDLEQGGAFHPLAVTRAWNWQQGCMLQWLPTDPDRTVAYNDREGDAFVSVLLDIHTGRRHTLPRALYSLSHDGRTALAVDFARLARCRPVTGYAADGGVASPGLPESCPRDDGIYRVDLATGESRLILSYVEVAAWGREGGENAMDDVPHWCEHLVWNPDDSRFLFLDRCWHPRDRSRMVTRLFTAAPDGTGLWCVSDHEMVSHFDWRTPHQILAWARRQGIGDHYFLFTDMTSDEPEVIGEGVLTVDGHCSFSPDRRWVLTDTYPDAARRQSTLLLYRWADGKRFDIGRFYSPPHLTGDIRCDLHPRWNRRGDQVCIDSAHEDDGLRQVYVLDVSSIVSI